MIALQLFAVLALVGVNAFFSAAEFSLVAVRQSRVRQLVEQGDARAKVVESCSPTSAASSPACKSASR